MIEFRDGSVDLGVGGELEDRARALGYTAARLDTGPKQAGAQALYESAGYAAIGNFNGNPVASFFGEKRLWPPGDRTLPRAGTVLARWRLQHRSI